jgi:hypothetical protein
MFSQISGKIPHGLSKWKGSSDVQARSGKTIAIAANLTRYRHATGKSSGHGLVINQGDRHCLPNQAKKFGDER